MVEAILSPLNKRWELGFRKDGTPKVRRLRDKREHMTKKAYLLLAELDVKAARLAAIAQDVSLAQIQLWELAV